MRNLMIWLSLTYCSPVVGAEAVVVVVHPSNSMERIEAEDIKKIYLNKTKTFPGTELGANAYDIRQAEIKAAFYEKVVGKDLPSMKSYWAKLVFTGRGKPPVELDSWEELVEAVAKDRQGLAYLPRSKATAKVKIVLDIHL